MLVFVLVSSYVIYRLPIRENADLHKTDLEKYKMELTEIYIDRGYPYDQFVKKIK